MAEIPYTVRLAPELLERIEKTAREQRYPPRNLIRAVLADVSPNVAGVPHTESPPNEPPTQPRSDSLRSHSHPAHPPAPDRPPGRLRNHRPDPPGRPREAQATCSGSGGEPYEFVTTGHEVRVEPQFRRMLLRLYLRCFICLDPDLGSSDVFSFGTGPGASGDEAPTSISAAGFSPGSSPRSYRFTS